MHGCIGSVVFCSQAYRKFLIAMYEMEGRPSFLFCNDKGICRLLSFMLKLEAWRIMEVFSCHVPIDNDNGSRLVKAKQLRIVQLP